MSAARLTSQRSAVERDLKEIGRRDPALAKSALAVAALKAAEIVDDRDNSATSRTAALRELREALRELRDLAPPDEKPDGVTGIEDRARLKLAAKK